MPRDAGLIGLLPLHPYRPSTRDHGGVKSLPELSRKWQPRLEAFGDGNMLLMQRRLSPGSLDSGYLVDLDFGHNFVLASASVASRGFRFERVLAVHTILNLACWLCRLVSCFESRIHICACCVGVTSRSVLSIISHRFVCHELGPPLPALGTFANMEASGGQTRGLRPSLSGVPRSLIPEVCRRVYCRR